jgi:membrane-associated phospholipid phosphatase
VFESLQALDLSALWWLRSFHAPLADKAAWLVAALANKGWLWWLIIAALWLRGRKQVSAHMAAALMIATVAGLPLKSLIGRARPDLYASQQLNIPMAQLMSTEHSFPSGHTLLAAAFAFVVFKYWKDYRAWLAFAFVGVVGAVRVFQGLHWPSDIIGSIFLGALAAYAAEYLLKWTPVQRLILKPARTAPAVSDKVEAATETSQKQLAGGARRN